MYVSDHYIIDYIMNQYFLYEMTELEMKSFAIEIAKRILLFPQAGTIIFCDGEVGSGKTTFARYFSEYLGIQATSPTYSIIEQRYNKKQNIQIIHGDFYRASHARSAEILEEYITDSDPVKSLSQGDLQSNIYLLEWLQEEIKKDFFSETPTLHIYFSHGENQKTRNISLSFSNPFSCSINTAKKLQEEYKTPVHVKNHIEVVRKVALFCAKKLQQNNIPIDLELVESGAILHDAIRYVDFPEYSESFKDHYKEDITPDKLKIWKKYQTIYKKKHHAHAMQDILEKSGYANTGIIVASHYTGEIYREAPFSWEEKCVYYADKRAMHDTFVTIKERLIDAAKRYAHEHIKGGELEEKILKFEKELQHSGKWKEADIQKEMM